MSNNVIQEKYCRKLFKNAADRFLQTLSKIRNNPARTKRRLVWELIQNAKDVPNKFGRVSIRISLNDKVLRFAHNGDAFTMDDFMGLVQQTSSKDSQNSDSEKTGKFGTGFISTYLLSDKIGIEGVAIVEGRYKKFNVELDRSADRSEDLAEVFVRDGAMVENVFNPESGDWVSDYDRREEEMYGTCFTYRLMSEIKERFAREGLDDLENTLPITLVNQPKLKKVEIESSGRIIQYICERKEDQLKQVSYVCVRKIENEVETPLNFMSYFENGVRIAIQIDESSQSLISAASNTPRLLRDFPLIGSEKFHFPFYLNGERFEPTEDRDGLILNGAETGSKPAISNRGIFEDAVNAVIKFNAKLCALNYSRRSLLALSRKPEADMQEETPVWFENIQKRWRQQLLRQKLLLSIRSNEHEPLENLCLPFVCSKTVSPRLESDGVFYRLVAQGNFPLRRDCSKLPVEAEYGQWADVIERERETWGDIRFEYFAKDLLSELATLETIDTFAGHAQVDHLGAVKWVSELIGLVLQNEEQGVALLNEYAVIPNRNGQFCCLKDLVSDMISPIPDALREVYDLCVEDKRKLNNQLVEPLVEQAGLSAKIKSFAMPEFASALKDLWAQNVEAAHRSVSQMLLISPRCNENTQKRRRELMGFAFTLGDVSTKDVISVDVDADSFMHEADRLWVKWAISRIENVKHVNELDEVFHSSNNPICELVRLLGHLDTYREVYEISDLDERATFPFQDGNIRALKDDKGYYLYKDESLLDEIKDVYNECKERDIREVLLDARIVGFKNARICNVEAVSNALNDFLKKSNDPLAVAVKILGVLPSDKKEYAKLHEYARDVLGDRVPVARSVSVFGFDWVPAITVVLKEIVDKVSAAKSITDLKERVACLRSRSESEMVSWLDGLISLMHDMERGSFAYILDDQDCRIFVNQNNLLCSRSTIYCDVDLSGYEELKGLAASEPVKYDIRDYLLHRKSTMSKLLGEGPHNFKSLTNKIDEVFKGYREKGLDPEDPSFRSLIFKLSELCRQDGKLAEALPNYKRVKDALLSRSLGDEKIGMLYRLNQRMPNDLLEALADADTDISQVIKLLQGIIQGTVTSGSGSRSAVVGPGIVSIAVSDGQYAGLSNDQMNDALIEAKKLVAEKLKTEGFEFTKGLCEKDYSLINGVMKDGNEYPLVVHSYLCNSRPFQLSPVDWTQLMKPRSMLLVRTTEGICPVPFRDLICNREKISLSFSTANLDIKDRLGSLAEVMRWFKEMHFDFGSLIPMRVGTAQLFDLSENPLADEQRAIQMKKDDESEVF